MKKLPSPPTACRRCGRLYCIWHWRTHRPTSTRSKRLPGVLTIRANPMQPLACTGKLRLRAQASASDTSWLPPWGCGWFEERNVWRVHGTLRQFPVAVSHIVFDVVDGVRRLLGCSDNDMEMMQVGATSIISSIVNARSKCACQSQGRILPCLTADFVLRCTSDMFHNVSCCLPCRMPTPQTRVFPTRLTCL